MPNAVRRICYVTGTRAEFGLMRTSLEAIRDHPALALQLIVTGMHLWGSHGRTVDAIRGEGWRIDDTVDWPTTGQAAATGIALAGVAAAFERLGSDIVLVCGDRAEAFAAASAGHLSGRFVAHVHGGDRAQGQADDALRHAITKLSHIHFPATQESRDRVLRLGERPETVFLTGTPGLDGIESLAAGPQAVADAVGGSQFALLILHPTRADISEEYATARQLGQAVLEAGVPKVVVVRPNNDPGHAGINRAWDELQEDPRVSIHADLPRPMYLGLLREAAFLAGNSSSGIIEAATFGTPVIDLGDRQAGRERSGNVRHVAAEVDLAAVARDLWNEGRPARWTGRNVYGQEGAGARIAHHLATVELDRCAQRKLITY